MPLNQNWCLYLVVDQQGCERRWCERNGSIDGANDHVRLQNNQLRVLPNSQVRAAARSYCSRQKVQTTHVKHPRAKLKIAAAAPHTSPSPSSSHSPRGPVWFQPLHTGCNQVCRHMWFLQTSNNTFLLLVKSWTLGFSHMWSKCVLNILRLVQSAGKQD